MKPTLYKIAQASSFVLRQKRANNYIPGIDDGQFDSEKLPADAKDLLKKYYKSIGSSSKDYTTYKHLGSNLNSVGMSLADKPLSKDSYNAYLNLLKYYNQNIYPKTEDYLSDLPDWDTRGHGFGSSKKNKGKVKYPSYEDYLKSR